MKKYIIILISIIIVCVIGWYVWSGREGVRSYYEGYVQIEPISLGEVIKRLEKSGCLKEGETCHYVLNKEENSLSVNLYRSGVIPFGPGGSYKIVGNKLYASFDIAGRRNFEKFKDAVKSLLQKSGNPVTPVEGAWTITQTRDTTGVVY